MRGAELVEQFSEAGVPGIPKAVFAERGPEPVGEPCRLAAARIERFRPKAAEVPEGAGADAPAHPDLPCGHRVGLRTDDVRGRADREPRRRSRVVQSPPAGSRPSG